MSFLSSPHEAFSAGFYRDSDFDFAVRGLLGHAASGGSEPGEVLATIAGVKDGDHAAWFTAWHALGQRLLGLAGELRESDHFDSASGTYLRAASYLSLAVDSASDSERLEVFRQHRAAWDGFIDTTVYSADRVAIPYEGGELPGYLIRPSDDEEPRATLILNNGSDGSHSSMWGDGAYGALARGYNVLFFDGPGQQSLLFERGIPFRHDWEKVVTPIVDFLLARPDVDGERLAVYGISQGGYWVPRALAFEKRLAAAIVDPAVVDVSTSWLGQLPSPLRKLFEEGKRESFDRDMAIGMRFGASTARTWAFRARPFRAGSSHTDSYFDTLTEVQRYALGDLPAQITTPLFITAPEDEQFWPGQSEQFAGALTGEKVLQPFTAAEGANFHCQPLARTLTDQRMFDWLDATLAR
ncbi:MAG: dipeptidyl aminopeptidase [Rhodoglobus sp.]|nr:dipeptidyl aminopeptidase [Rhodoglobus sp.]